MRFTLKLTFLILFSLSFLQNSFSDNHNIYETLEIIKNDLKTLERAVYSGSIEINTSDNFNKCLVSTSSELLSILTFELSLDEVLISIEPE